MSFVFFLVTICADGAFILKDSCQIRKRMQKMGLLLFLHMPSRGSTVRPSVKANSNDDSYNPKFKEQVKKKKNTITDHSR